MFIACNNQTHSPTEKKYALSLHPKIGAKYYYTINNETDIQLTVKNKKTENVNRTTIGLRYEVLKDSAENAVLKITYDSFHVLMKNNDNVTQLSTQDGQYSIDPAERALTALKGNSIFVTLNSKGQITSISGYKEIADKLISEMNITDANERKQFENQLSSLSGEGFVKNNLEQSLNIFPDSALYVGDTWQKKQTASTELQLDLETKYKLESVENNTATVTSRSEINTNNNTINVMGTQAVANLKGDEEGEIKLDNTTGMLRESNSEVDMKGNINIMNTAVPITIQIKKEIKARTEN